MWWIIVGVVVGFILGVGVCWWGIAKTFENTFASRF
jgi:hypothetical protein